jgi:S1-C subfamily serine protease
LPVRAVAATLRPMLRRLAPFLLLLLLSRPAPAQDPPAPPTPDGAADVLVKRALEAEARQVELIARIAPAVAAIFPGEGPPQGGGSGVLIDPEGYILTNFHVSSQEKVQQVGLNDGVRYRGRLLGIDPGGDISLIKLDPRPDGKPWPFVTLGVSDAVKVGERVYAMGNPFLLAEDFAPTVTEGVVSGVHRYRDASGSSDLVYGDSIQMDASINPGNSGGPLFDARGRLLGINGLGGFRPDRGRVNVGVGFAASIDQIKEFVLDLRAGKQCQHGTMNATVRDMEVEGGIRTQLTVDAIARDAPAYSAGLRLGDIVRRFEGVLVTTQNQLLTLVSRLPAGRRVTLDVERPREDGQGNHQAAVTFRLDPLWSGPAQGEWQPDPALVRHETLRLLEQHRATGPALSWSREESWRLPGLAIERRVLRVDGRRVRLESPRGAEVWDGARGWRVASDGTEEPLQGARKDLLAATAEALHAVSAPGGEAGVASIELAGGERLAGRLVARIDIRDKAGRRRIVYLDPVTGAIAGLAFPDEAGVWVEEVWTTDGAKRGVVRVDHATGAPRERADDVLLVPGPQEPALFSPAQKAGGGQ